MKIVITGGGGFLGNRLARQLLERGSLTAPSGDETEIEALTILDVVISDAAREGFDARVSFVEGDVADPDLVASVIDRPDVSVFHLASMVSGECEVRFDDALRANLDGMRYLLEACRDLGTCPRVVFASSLATFGGSAMPSVVDDTTRASPQTTYGMTKRIGELLINDYSRKGFIDGRSVRLPTVIIRPGKPNTAASSFASGMFREPLNGETCELPVARSQEIPVIGYRDVVDSFVALHEAPLEHDGEDRAFGLPSISITVEEGIAELRSVAEERGIRLGDFVDAPDPVIQRIVSSWPVATAGPRGLALGVPEPAPLREVIEFYLEDYGCV